MPRMTPEEATKVIKEAAVEGTIEMASDTLTAEYDPEIQRIFTAVMKAYTGKEPRSPIWAADGYPIGFVLDWDEETGKPTARSLAACEAASLELRIKITPRTVWEDAGAALRALDPKVVKS